MDQYRRDYYIMADEPVKEEKEQSKRPIGFNILGYNVSYGKAFGIAFLVIFLLLFFPGFGVSSSSINKKAEKEEGLPQDKQKINNKEEF